MSLREKNGGDHTVELALDVSDFESDDSGCTFNVLGHKPTRAPLAVALLGLTLIARRARSRLG
ncbi:MAG TPA: hypothetical protein VHB79_16405 [Polyangiaceae bacterium]|nr:hypothetical protein [Polyangiaceae bacterium]